MSDLADSTIAFSCYGLLCSATKPVTPDALFAALGKAGIECDVQQFARAVDAMIDRTWVESTDGERLFLRDAGHWCPFVRDRSDTDVKNPTEDSGWKGWTVRGPNGDTVSLADRLALVGDSQ